MVDLANTNAYLAQQMALTIQQYVNYANTDILVYTTPPDGGPYGNGWVYFTTVTNGTVFQPSYPTLVNTVVGPAAIANADAASATIANTNANIANTNAWSLVEIILQANSDAIAANAGAQVANADAWQANTNANMANVLAWSAVVQANIANTNSWLGAAAANNTYTLVLIANSNVNNGVAFIANSNAAFFAAEAALSNTHSWNAVVQASLANAGAQVANTNAWIAANTGVVTHNAVISAIGYIPYNSNNPSGYLSTINSSVVTSALGYTPYNSTNPSGYLSTINSTLIASALGYVPFSSNGGTIQGTLIVDGIVSGTETIEAETFTSTQFVANTPSGAGAEVLDFVAIDPGLRSVNFQLALNPTLHTATLTANNTANVAGYLCIGNLPLANPHIAGALWNSSGVLNISSG